MTDDIVTRLRNETDDFRIFGLVLEAADEIERLREDRNKWKALAIKVITRLEAHRDSLQEMVQR